LQKAILAYASECWSAASTPAQEAAAVAFDTTPEMDTYRSQLSNLHKHCTIRLYEALKNCGLAVAAPKGAFYLYPSFYPYSKQLKSLGIYTSRQLSRWLIEECGMAALPGSVFGEDDEGVRGGRYRLRMATSYLYFKDQEERYTRGYELLSHALDGGANATIKLPLLEKAIVAIENAVAKLKNV
jgi:aspartate aminotransferase